jgi:hypothetical protein
MYDPNLKWDRQELYEKVWRVPLRKLAAEYGVSDVALGKICRKLQIPLPGAGHWTKIDCGHSIPRPPLPEGKNLPDLFRKVREQEAAPLLSEDSSELERIERLEKSIMPFVTKAMLNHPLIEKTRLVLRDARPKNRGVLWGGREVDWLDIRVSKECLTRALRIMAAIVVMLEKEGFQLLVEKKQLESTSAVVLGERIEFGVIEKSRQVKPVVAPNTKDSTYTYNPTKLVPTGVLSIEIWSYYSGGAKKVWRDKDAAPLESQLPKFIAGLVRIALRKRADRKVREERELAEQKKVDEVTAILRVIEAEEMRTRTLKKEAVSWQRAKRIREYVAAVRVNAEMKADAIQRTKDLEWVAWAEAQADRIDPLKESPHSIVDDKAQVLERLKSLRWGWYSG